MHALRAFLGELPVRLFGIASGLELHYAHKRSEELKQAAEFDLTQERQRDLARRSVWVAFAKTIGFWVVTVFALRWLFQ